MTELSLQPGKEAFATAYAENQAQLIWTRLAADLMTPVGAMLRLMDAQEPSFLLESVEGGATRGRYSVIGLKPDVIWRCSGDRAEQAFAHRIEDAVFEPCPQPSLEAFRELLASSRLEAPEALPPMAAGLVGYMAYDMVRLMEKLPKAPLDEIGIPDACFIRPQIMLIFDNVADALFITTPIWPKKGKEQQAEKAYEAGRKRIEQVIRTLSRPLPASPCTGEAVRLTFTPHLPKPRYLAQVARAKEHIAAGDIFQAVLSQRFSSEFTLPPFALYRALRHLNPSPFLFFLNFAPHFALVGSSPEIMVRLRGGKVTIRPIAGTRKRGRNREEDKALAADLLSDPKELAEHLMLLDLGRNDVGRVAKTGSVRVTEQMVIEHYSHVMHIVSNVEGELDDARFDAISALAAGFPAGTVSGAPKVRAMEIINDLEPVKRSFYAGCVGYFSASGAMDSAITLRTGLVKNGRLYVQAGGGIVADSDPEAEYQESLNKAQALMRAAEEAGRFV